MFSDTRPEFQMLTMFYISESHTPLHLATNEAKFIARHALPYNDMHEITGTLLFSGTHYAAILEGLSESVDQIYKRIEQDGRHTVLSVLERKSINQRSFADWSFLNCDISVYAECLIINALDGVLSSPNASGIILAQFMREMVGARHP